MDVVLLERIVESAGEGGVEDCGRESEGEGEDAADDADERSGERAEPAEQRRHPDEDFRCGSHDRDNIRNVQPVCGFAVGIQSGLELGAEVLVRDAVVEMPDIHRVKPEILLPWAAVRDVVEAATCRVRTKVAGAIIPEADVVEVVDAQDVAGDRAGLVEKSVGERVLGQI